jgi:hypothetical protein
MTTAGTVAINPYGKRGLRRTALAVSEALLTAILPVLVGLVLLVSAVLRKPLISTIGPYVPCWATVSNTSTPDSVRRATVWSGIALIAVGILQGVGEILGLSLFDPAGLAIRTLGSVVLLLVIVIVTTRYLKRHPL